MARPPLPLGSHGKIKVWQEGAVFVARTKFRDMDGVVRFVKRNGKSKAAAERALKAALVQRRAPIVGALVVPDTRFSRVAELWLAEVERAVDAGRRSPGTLDTYRIIYRVHVEPEIGALRVREVTTPAVDRALTAIKAKSASRARTAKVVISQVMAFAARHGAITVNPVREVGRIDGAPKRRPRSLTAEERGQWLAAVEADRRAREWDLPDLTRMMLATGCRIGECLAIGWTEVDLDGGTVEVCWRLVRRRGVGLLRLPSTKTGERGERLIPLPSWAVKMLRHRRARLGDTVEAVFPDSHGGWRDPTNVRRVWRAVRDQAEMDGMVSHTLRKTVASFLDDADVSTRKISDQLGHARVSMTQDKYLGRKITDRETARVLEGIVPQSPADVDE
jgi:integrase